MGCTSRPRGIASDSVSTVVSMLGIFGTSCRCNELDQITNCTATLVTEAYGIAHSGAVPHRRGNQIDNPQAMSECSSEVATCAYPSTKHTPIPESLQSIEPCQSRNLRNRDACLDCKHFRSDLPLTHDHWPHGTRRGLRFPNPDLLSLSNMFLFFILSFILIFRSQVV